MKPRVKRMKLPVEPVKPGPSVRRILATVSLLMIAAFAGSRGWAQTSVGFMIASPAFPANGPIPQRYTCKGSNAGSPPLAWKGVPAGAKTLALIVKDPDAPRGTFIHWVIYNLPAAASGLEAGVPPAAKLANGALQGNNTLGNIGYMGPCPPPGPAHHYHFYLMALDTALDLQPGATAEQVEAASRGHVKGKAELVGTFAR